MQVPTDKQDLFDKIDELEIFVERWKKVEDMCKGHMSSIEDERFPFLATEEFFEKE